MGHSSGTGESKGHQNAGVRLVYSYFFIYEEFFDNLYCVLYKYKGARE